MADTFLDMTADSPLILFGTQYSAQKVKGDAILMAGVIDYINLYQNLFKKLARFSYGYNFYLYMTTGWVYLMTHCPLYLFLNFQN